MNNEQTNYHELSAELSAEQFNLLGGHDGELYNLIEGGK